MKIKEIKGLPILFDVIKVEIKDRNNRPKIKFIQMGDGEISTVVSSNKRISKLF